jgi:uncharacterized membrane protein
MMYYGGTGGWLGVTLMAFSMIALGALFISLVFWAAKSFGSNTEIKSPPSAALGILQERFAKGEISKEEYAQGSQLIHSAR